MRFLSLKCRKIYHLCFIVHLLGSVLCFAEEGKDYGRKPANFVPDDDMIVVPMVIEKNVYERFNERHLKEFNSAKKTLRFWMSQEEYAEAYGLENRVVMLPTQDQKERFFQRRFMRFLSQDVERSTNQTVTETLEELTNDDEIDSIRAIEMHEKVLVKAEKSRGKKTVKKTKNVKVGKEKFRFGFQPRLEIGMARFTLRSRFFRARAWLGINGNQELYIERRFKSTNTRAFMNYFIEQNRVLASVDQRLSRGWSLRFTHNKTFEDIEVWDQTGLTENNVLQLRFNMRF